MQSQIGKRDPSTPPAWHRTIQCVFSKHNFRKQCQFAEVHHSEIQLNVSNQKLHRKYFTHVTHIS